MGKKIFDIIRLSKEAKNNLFRTAKSGLLFLSFILYFPYHLFGQINDMKFEHLSLEQGIAHNMIYDIYQDHEGFLWFGTMYGLIKYDGKSYKIYRNDPSDPGSISFDDVLCIYEDSDEHLWIGTWGGGLNRFDRQTEKFIRYEHNSSDKKSLSSNVVKCIYEDRIGDLWIGTEDGLNRMPAEIRKGGNKKLSAAGNQFDRYFLNLWELNSLSNNTITAIQEDNADNLWIGTLNGLNRFDKVTGKFTRYFSLDSAYTRTYSDKLFDSIDTLKSKNYLIASIQRVGDKQNLSKEFALSEKSTVLVVSVGEGKNEVLGEKVDQMYDFGWLESNGRVIWESQFNQTYFEGGAMKNRIRADLISLNPGTYRIHYQTDDSHSYENWNNHAPNHPDFWGIAVFEVPEKQAGELRKELKHIINHQQNSISHNHISSLCQGEDEEILWVGTLGGGLNKLNTTTGHFSHKKNDRVFSGSQISNFINTIYKEESGILWIGSPAGLSKFDPVTGECRLYSHNPMDPYSLSSDNVTSIRKDRSGILWIGTFWGGIDKFDDRKAQFTHVRQNISGVSGQLNNNVFALVEDRKDCIWFGTPGGGLTVYDCNKRKFKNYYHNSENSGSLGSNSVWSLLETDAGSIWIGTFGGGLNRYDSGTDTFEKFYYNKKNPNSVNGNMILCLLEDHDGYIWFGTNGSGLYRFNIDDGKFTNYHHDPKDSNSIGNNHVYSLHEDREGNLWIGGTAGLDKLNSDRTRFRAFRHNPSDSTSLSYDYVYVIHESKYRPDGLLWIGTAGGLNKFDPISGKFKHFTEENGLPNRVICGILEDINGFLWISTNRGLSKFDRKTEKFRNYDLADGLQSNMFNRGAYTALESGELVFGGINGFNVFNPIALKSRAYIPSVFITAFEKFNQPVIFDKSITDIRKINLSHKDNFFTLRFASLDYRNPEKNQYAYKLEGLDRDWIYSGNINFASYTNLNPGSYTFRAKGTNSDGVWNERGTSVIILVHPPYWQTWWFKLMISLTLIAALLLFIHRIRDKEKRKSLFNKRMSELKLQALRSQMNPHFLFNTLNSIQYFISCNDQKSAQNYLSKFSKLMRSTLDNSEKSTIPISKEVEALKIYLELQLLRFENKFEYRISIDSLLDIYNIEIPTMIIQPYVENAITHGLRNKTLKGEIIISIKLDAGIIICTIEDNGIGIVKALKLKKLDKEDHTSTGMRVTRERVDIINSARKDKINVAVTDLGEMNPQKSGTKVTIFIPV